MERMTLKQGVCRMASTEFCFKHKDCYNCEYGRKCFKLLAAYEDTGLEPEEIKTLMHRGRWILDSSDEYASHYSCSRCGAEIDLCNEIYTETTPEYCQHCGAKMDEGGDHE